MQNSKMEWVLNFIKHCNKAPQKDIKHIKSYLYDILNL